jgi:hypothetical protein
VEPELGVFWKVLHDRRDELAAAEADGLFASLEGLEEVLEEKHGEVFVLLEFVVRKGRQPVREGRDEA